VLHDQARTEFEERLTGPIHEFIQDGPPGRVSDRAINVHMGNDMQAWACMSTGGWFLPKWQNVSELLSACPD